MASERLKRQTDHLLDEAEEAISGPEWEVVGARAQAVLAIGPENSEGLAFLEVAQQAQTEEAVTA